MYSVEWFDENDANEQGIDYGAYVLEGSDIFAGPFNTVDEAYDWISFIVEG